MTPSGPGGCYTAPLKNRPVGKCHGRLLRESQSVFMAAVSWITYHSYHICTTVWYTKLPEKLKTVEQ